MIHACITRISVPIFLWTLVFSDCSGGVITFDDRLAGAIDGSAYSSFGVHFLYGEMDGVVSVDEIVEFRFLNPGLQIVSGVFAISGQNAASTFDGLTENLMVFDVPIRELSVISDDQNDERVPDIVRLIALEPTANSRQFRVVSFVEAFDNTFSMAENTMALHVPDGARYIAFQRTTEAESFDNLAFTAVPEPGTLAMVLLAGGFYGAAAVRFKRRTSAGSVSNACDNGD